MDYESEYEDEDEDPFERETVYEEAKEKEELDQIKGFQEVLIMDEEEGESVYGLKSLKHLVRIYQRRKDWKSTQKSIVKMLEYHQMVKSFEKTFPKLFDVIKGAELDWVNHLLMETFQDSKFVYQFVRIKISLAQHRASRKEVHDAYQICEDLLLFLEDLDISDEYNKTTNDRYSLQVSKIMGDCIEPHGYPELDENGLMSVANYFYTTLFHIFHEMEGWKMMRTLKNILCLSLGMFTYAHHPDFNWAIEKIPPITLLPFPMDDSSFLLGGGNPQGQGKAWKLNIEHMRGKTLFVLDQLLTNCGHTIFRVEYRLSGRKQKAPNDKSGHFKLGCIDIDLIQPHYSAQKVEDKIPMDETHKGSSFLIIRETGSTVCCSGGKMEDFLSVSPIEEMVEQRNANNNGASFNKEKDLIICGKESWEQNSISKIGGPGFFCPPPSLRDESIGMVVAMEVHLHSNFMYFLVDGIPIPCQISRLPKKLYFAVELCGDYSIEFLSLKKKKKTEVALSLLGKKDMWKKLDWER